ncbi:two component LuxR family transcriptional regulator [Cupriavidus sp. GA3-3]|nr:two component LuxR family transcriptional regulator [Cupriavidus sp. GA3-3]
MEDARLPPKNTDSADPRAGELVYRIHAARDDEGWRGVIALVREQFAAGTAVLARRHLAGGQGAVLYGAPEDAAFFRTFAEYSPRNPWFLSSHAYQPLQVIGGDDMLSSSDLIRTDYYHALLRPHQYLHRLCGVVAREADVVYFLELYRREDQRRFGAKEKAEFRGLLAHMALSLENRWQRHSAADLSQALMRIIDGHPNATFLVEQDGRIVYCNRSAHALCGQGSGLYRDGEYLAAVMPTDHRALREMLAGLARGAGDMRDAHAAHATLVPTQVLSVCAPGFTLPTTLTLQPAAASLRTGFGEERAVVVVSARRQGTEHAHHDCLFARQFKLSEAQARVNALVFAGHSIASLAEVLHVSENTVRSHLKQIFQKTNTHGQMELVRLHAQHCPPA